MRRQFVTGAAEVAGVGLVAYGLGRWSVELALIVLGVVMVFAAERWSQ